jgi:hypothetical protein
MCSYIVNARKKPLNSKHDNKFSYNVRYYFTSATVTIVAGDDMGAREAIGAGGSASPKLKSA